MRKWLSPPSPCIGSMMIPATRSGYLAKAASISWQARASSASMSFAMPPSRSNSIAGLYARGQSNLGNRAILSGIVFVRLIV